MDIYVMNTDYVFTYLVDSYESLIWTDRFGECGDFELYTAASQELLDNIKQDYYLYVQTSDRLMIVESIKIETSFEDELMLKITGRSLESLLYRRIIWGNLSIEGNLQNSIKDIITNNVINPSDSNRAIPGFIFKESEDERITSLEYEAQFQGDNLYDIIKTACDEKHIGFRILFDLVEHTFTFELYLGTDRSFSQDERPFVVFSPEFDNLNSSDYTDDITNYRNVVLVGGEGEGTDKKYVTVGEASGLSRREIYTDSGITSTTTDKDGNQKTLTPAEYEEELRQKGQETLKEYKKSQTFEGEMETKHMFVYLKDFFIGDIVQVENEFHIQARARIIEIITSHSDKGYEYYPKFEIVEEEEES